MRLLLPHQWRVRPGKNASNSAFENSACAVTGNDIATTQIAPVSVAIPSFALTTLKLPPLK
jgi:hypothetical protein